MKDKRKRHCTLFSGGYYGGEGGSDTAYLFNGNHWKRAERLLKNSTAKGAPIKRVDLYLVCKIIHWLFLCAVQCSERISVRISRLMGTSCIE